MNASKILLAAATLAGGVWAYKHFKKAGEFGPFEPETPDDYIVDEWVASLPQQESARLQIWQNVQTGSFYGRWARFESDGKTVIAFGGTPDSPGEDEVRHALELLVIGATSPQVSVSF